MCWTVGNVPVRTCNITSSSPLSRASSPWAPLDRFRRWCEKDMAPVFSCFVRSLELKCEACNSRHCYIQAQPATRGIPVHVQKTGFLSAGKLTDSATGRLRLNLNPLNLMRWIDSWPFDKTWKPRWIDSTRVNRFNGRAMNLEWIFIKTPSRARKSFSKASPYFFCKDRARTGPVSTGTDSMPFDYFAWFQKIQPNEIHSMNLLHF